MMKYPISIQNFEKLREEQFLYTDKTDAIFNLANSGSYYMTNDGRIDLLMKTKDYIYILEFKINESVEAALKHIKEKRYAKTFEADGRILYKIGVNFSTNTRKINS